jgi:hypothetical protein
MSDPDAFFEDQDEALQLPSMQDLIDSGDAWRLEGSIGRQCMAAIEAGECTLGESSHRDYYGNRVPSKHEVEPGTKGSQEFVDRMSKERNVN